MTGPTVGSLFSGAGGFDLGFDRAGFAVAWQVEIDPTARRVLARHWPNVVRFRDVVGMSRIPRRLGGWHARWGSPDVIVGGFPCQDLSVAGNRAGLGGGRSGLFWQMMRIVNGLRPRFLVWENVPGLLSSDGGRDFRRVLSALADRGYFGCVRVLDARHFGVPQRRRRVFGVFATVRVGPRNRGRLAEPTPREDIERLVELCAEVLALTHGEGGHPAAGGEAGADAAGGAPAGPGGVACIAYLEPRHSRGSTTHNAVGVKDGSLSDTLQPTDGVGGVAIVNIMGANRRADRPEGGLYVEADASVSKCLDGTGLNPACAQGGTVVAFGGNATTERAVETALSAKGGTGRLDFETETFAVQCHGSNVGAPGTLRSGGSAGNGVPVVAFNWQSGGDCRINPSPLPDALSVGQVPAVMAGDPLYYSHDYNQDRVYGDTGPTPALTAADSNRTRNHLVAGTVRRLTPTECERLMGWPDGWTELGGDGKRIKDGPRYRLCGNGVVGTVAEWIARRLMDVIRRNPA